MKRLVLSTSIAVSILAGCGAGAPSATPSQGAGSPAPPVSATPSASPAASAVFPAWYTGDRVGAGILSAGSHTTRTFTPAFTFTVPAGWFNSLDDSRSYDLIRDTPANAAEQAASGGLAHEITAHRYGSPYWFCDAWEDHHGATAAELVASIVTNKAIAASEPVDVTIGGLTGKQVDLRLDPAWKETCPGDPPTLDLGDTRTRVIFLDTPGGEAVFINVGSLHSALYEGFLAEAMPIIASFRFDIAQ